MKDDIKFRVNGIEWKIKIVDMNDEALKMGADDYRAGITHYSEGTVYIQREMIEGEESLLRTLLLHELVHVYQMSYGMLQVMWDTEVVADFVSVHIKNIMRTYYEIMVDINKIKKSDCLKEILDNQEKEFIEYNIKYKPKHMAEDFIEENMEHIPRID